MNNIIPASRLGELLAAKTGADVEICTKFVKEYFGLIEATLATGEDVTIKGIGTFKLTGDDVEPVVYVVDKELAATVNAPFDAFTPVELADNELPEANEEPEPEPIAEAIPQVAVEEQPGVEAIVVEENAEPEEEAVEAEAEAEEDAAVEPDVEAEEGEEAYYEPHTQVLPRGWAAFWMVIAFVLGLLLGVAGGYFGYKEINKYLANMPETVQTETSAE